MEKLEGSSQSSSLAIAAAAASTSFGGPSFTTGSVSPVEDFQAVVDYCSSSQHLMSPNEMLQCEEALRSAMTVMGEIVVMLVTVGGTNPHFRKAVACLKVSSCLSF